MTTSPWGFLSFMMHFIQDLSNAGFYVVMILRTSMSDDILFVLFCFVFLERHPQHMEVPRLGVKSELQLPAYTTGPGNAGSFNLLIEARDRTCILMDDSQILNLLSHNRNSLNICLDPTQRHTKSLLKSTDHFCISDSHRKLGTHQKSKSGWTRLDKSRWNDIWQA